MNLLTSRRPVKTEGVNARRNRKENDIMKANLKKTLGMAALGMALLGTTVQTRAGYLNTPEVFVGNHAVYAYARGSIVGARYSADSRQFIMCFISATDDSAFPLTIRCEAVDRAGNRAFCLSADPWHVKEVQGMTDSSYISFSRNRAAAQCESLTISNYSYHLK
ncbi:MAG: hypothetical protein ACREBC_28920 [Pyrinomonadaceae bacterium]